MKRRLLETIWPVAVFLLPVAAHAAAGPGDAAPAALLPVPHHVHFTGERLALRDGLRIVVPAGATARVVEIAELLHEGLESTAKLSASISRDPQDAAGGAIVLSLAGPPVGITTASEAYTVYIGDSVAVGAADPRGLLWGVQTLLQCLDVSGGRVTLPKGEIVDRPVREWRGLMLDPVRAFFDLGFVRRTIRVMSAYKMNVLHFHLIDDQAWRFESRAFPKLNPPGEPCYTQAELRELVAYAARYGVEVIPEFDFPGHSRSAVKAYPALDCEGRSRAEEEAIFCSAKPFTWEFIEKILDEAATVFPSEYVHLGADEPYAIKRWGDCPDCQARMKAKGVTSLDALYHTFVIELNERVQRRGKKLIVWNDAINPGVEPMPPQDILIDAWNFYERVQPLAEAGYTMLCSPRSPLYITSLGQREGLPLSEVLRWNATRFEFPMTKYPSKVMQLQPLSPKAKILGGHASAWTTEQWLTERRIYPRVLAVAEILWSEGREFTAADFEARYRAAHVANLRRLGVPDYDALPADTLDGALVAGGDWRRSPRGYGDFILNFEALAPDDATDAACCCAAQPGRRLRRRVSRCPSMRRPARASC